MNFIEQIKATRRISAPLLAITTPDAAASIYDIAQVVNKGITGAPDGGAPMLSWDIVKGVVALTDSAKPLVKVICGEQSPEMMNNPTEVLSKLALLQTKKDSKGEYIGFYVFMHNLHFWIKEPSIIQGLWNLRDNYKVGRRTVIITAPQIMLPRELQDVIVIDYPLPDADQIKRILKETYEIVGVPEPDDKRREAETEALIGTPSAYLAETVSAMCITKNGMDMDGLRQRKRQMVAQTRGCTMWGGSEIEIAGSMNFLSFMGRYCTGPERPGCFMLFDEIGDAMAGNAGDNTGVSQDIHAYILKWMEDFEIPGIMSVGIPGVGKTYGPKALSNKYNIPLIIADVGGMKESGVGDSEANVRAATKLAMAVAGGKVLAIGTTNSTANLSPQLMSRFGFTFFFDLPSAEARMATWKIYIKKYGLDPAQAMPDDTNWTPREIRNCCRNAYSLSYPLTEAARYVVPVYKSGAQTIANLRQEAHEKYLSDANPGFYQNPQVSVESVDYGKPSRRTITGAN